MSNTTQNQQALTPAQEVRELWTTDQMSLIRNTIAPGISLSELHLFAMICKRTGLDPFTRQIYAIKRGDRMTIQTGIDGYRVLAVRTGELAGIDDAIYDDESGEHPNKATVTVWRLVQGHRVAFTATARWTEYVQTGRDGKPTSMWAKMPYLMLAKCAESLALRKAFPAELSGIYTAEEMAQADTTDDAPTATPQPQHTRRNAQPISEVVDAAQDAPAPSQPRTYNPLSDTPLRKRLSALGIRTVDDVETFVGDAQARFGRMPLREACYAQVAYLESPPGDNVDDVPATPDLSELPTGGIRP